MRSFILTWYRALRSGDGKVLWRSSIDAFKDPATRYMVWQPYLLMTTLWYLRAAGKAMARYKEALAKRDINA